MSDPTATAIVLRACEAETVEDYDKPYVVCGKPALWRTTVHSGASGRREYLLCAKHAAMFDEHLLIAVEAPGGSEATQ